MLHPLPQALFSLLNNSYQNPPSARETAFNRDFHLKMFTLGFIIVEMLLKKDIMYSQNYSFSSSHVQI